MMLQKGARQGDPIPASLFILAFEIILIWIKSNQNIQPINIFDYDFHYTEYYFLQLNY